MRKHRFPPSKKQITNNRPAYALGSAAGFVLPKRAASYTDADTPAQCPQEESEEGSGEDVGKADGSTNDMATREKEWPAK